MYNLKPNPPIEISIKRDEKNSLHLTTNWDASLDDMKQIFKSILYWMTFSSEQIDEMFKEEE